MYFDILFLYTVLLQLRRTVKREPVKIFETEIAFFAPTLQGLSAGERTSLMKVFESYHGLVSNTFCERVTAVIADASNANDVSISAKQKMVTVDWICDSISCGKQKPIREYQINQQTSLPHVFFI